MIHMQNALQTRLLLDLMSQVCSISIPTTWYMWEVCTQLCSSRLPHTRSHVHIHHNGCHSHTCHGDMQSWWH